MAFGFGFGFDKAARRTGGGESAAPDPIEAQFTHAAISAGWSGLTDTTSDATQMRGVMNLQGLGQGVTFWAGRVKASELHVRASSQFGHYKNLLNIQVNGGAITTPTYSGSGDEYPVFSGLDYAEWHNVFVRWTNESFYVRTHQPITEGGNPANVLRATGVPAQVVPYSNWRQPGDGLCSHACAIMAPGDIDASLAPYQPSTTRVPAERATWTNQRQNVPSLAVQGNAARLAITSYSRFVFVSVDGAAPTIYDRGSVNAGLTVHDCAAGSHVYRIWQGSDGGLLCVGAHMRNGALVDPNLPRLFQIGDSKTHGAGASSAGHTETFRVAAALGFVGGNFGITGDTTASGLARLPEILDNIDVRPDDVWVIALGVNDRFGSNGGALDGTQTANYQDIIDLLLTAGVQKIICRGVVMANATGWNQTTASIGAIAAGYADSRVQFCDTTDWVVTRPDGTHEDDTGYNQLTALCVASYPDLIAA